MTKNLVEIKRLKEMIGTMATENLVALAGIEAECEKKLVTYKTKIMQFINSI